MNCPYCKRLIPGPIDRILDGVAEYLSGQGQSFPPSVWHEIRLDASVFLEKLMKGAA